MKLKKVGKTTRPFRYDLNQIPYTYTVEVRSGFKGLDLIDRVPDELWTEVRDINIDAPKASARTNDRITFSDPRSGKQDWGHIITLTLYKPFQPSFLDTTPF